MTITLVSPKFRVKEVLKKTQAKGFREAQKGDILSFKMVLERTTNYGRGNYATYLTVHNETQEETGMQSQSMLLDIIHRCFILEEVLNEYQ